MAKRKRVVNPDPPQPERPRRDKAGRAIVSLGVGGWYPRGVRRLRDSVYMHKPGLPILSWTEWPAGCPRHDEQPYAFKTWAIEQAMRNGFESVLWLDAACYLVNDPSPVFDRIEQVGYCVWHNGFNCANTCTDRLLAHCGVSRDDAERMPELAACALGFDLRKPEARELLRAWAELGRLGLFQGSWRRSPEDSTDPRFLFARHDQSALSLLMNIRGMTDWLEMGDGGLARYTAANQRPSPTVVLENQGL